MFPQGRRTLRASVGHDRAQVFYVWTPTSLPSRLVLSTVVLVICVETSHESFPLRNILAPPPRDFADSQPRGRLERQLPSKAGRSDPHGIDHIFTAIGEDFQRMVQQGDEQLEGAAPCAPRPRATGPRHRCFVKRFPAYRQLASSLRRECNPPSSTLTALLLTSLALRPTADAFA